MQNLPYIIGLIILSLLTVGLIWKIMPCVIGILALVGLAQVYWVWRNWQSRRR